MKGESDEKISRADFIKSGLRFLAAASLGAFGLSQVLKGGSTKTPQECVQTPECGSCGAYAGCGYERAKSKKQRQSNDGQEGR